MSQEVGSAYVTLLPSARGFGKQIEGEVGGGFDAAEKQGSSLFSGMFKKVVGFAATAAVAVGGYFSAKAIFGGGLDRLLNIEDAQAKLKGLGHDADSVSAIMTSALDAVRGTAYGLDSAATVAASAVAAGIKPGQDLTKYLQLTADAATIAGTSMDEMGSIMNKVTSSGFAMTDNLNQLADRGIPIFQWLQDEYGVSAEELRKMVSEGKVDAETFNRVISENIGGAALASGDTTRGAMANMGAALSRVGANLLSGVFPLFKEVFQGITTLLGPVEAAAKDVGTAFGEWTTGTLVPAVKGVIDLFQGDFTPALREALGWEEDSRIVDVLLSVRGAAIGVSDTLSGIVGVIKDGDFNGALFAWLGAQEDSPFVDLLFRIRDAAQQVVPMVTGAFGAMIAAFQSGGTDVTSTGLAGLFETIGLAARNYIDPMIPAFKSLWDAISPIIPQIIEAVGAFNPLGLVFKALLPVLPELAGLLGDLASTFVTALGPILAAIVPVIAQVASILVGALSQAFVSLMPVITGLLPVVTTLVGVIGGTLLTVVQALTPVLLMVANVIAQLMPVVAQLIAPLLGVVTALLPLVEIAGQLIATLLPPLIDLFMAILQPVLALIAPLVEALAPVLQLIGTLIGEIVVPIIAVLADWLGKLVAFLAPVIAAIAGGLVGAITSLITWLANGLAGLANFATEGVKKIADFASSVGDHIGDAIQWFLDLPGKIGEALGDAGSWLKDTGKKIIGGLIDGLKGAFDGVKDALGGLTDLLPDWKGPAARDRVLLTKSGQLIIGGLIDGLESKYGAVHQSLTSLTADIAGTAVPSMSANVDGVLAAGEANGASAVTQNIYPQPGQSEQEIGDAAARRLAFSMVGVPK